MSKKTLTFAIMDAPYENARTTTALRLVDAAVRKGHDVNVFAYEGAVYVAFAKQQAHANAVHGRDAAQEDHPLPHKWVDAIHEAATQHGAKVEWINCGLCVDERGAGETLPWIKRGSPADLWKWVEASDNTLVIGTR